jgi:hypothetical protein
VSDEGAGELLREVREPVAGHARPSGLFLGLIVFLLGGASLLAGAELALRIMLPLAVLVAAWWLLGSLSAKRRTSRLLLCEKAMIVDSKTRRLVPWADLRAVTVTVVEVPYADGPWRALALDFGDRAEVIVAEEELPSVIGLMVERAGLQRDGDSNCWTRTAV